MAKYASADDEWRAILSGKERGWTVGRSLFRLLPSNPRCKICAAPFHGPGGMVMRMVGKKPWPKNPMICGQCFNYLSKHSGGAEIELSLLFADVRGSTALAEGMSPATFTALLNRFYKVASDVIVPTGAVLDKFVGDEVVALFIPGLTGPKHAQLAIEAGLGLLNATGHRDPSGPWIPVGGGVHTGVAYVGTIGAPGQITDFTALGDPVNTTARLASAAGAGELLVTLDAVAAARAGGLELGTSERRDLALKGKQQLVSVDVLRVGQGTSPTA